MSLHTRLTFHHSSPTRTHAPTTNSLSHKLKAGFNSFMHKHSSSHAPDPVPLVQRDRRDSHTMFFSTPANTYADDDEISKEIGSLLMEDGDELEDEPVVYMYSSEEPDVAKHPDAIKLLPKQQVCVCHVCMYACMHVCMYVCMYMCVSVTRDAL
jgi:hypothetical protein